jgi:acetyltransferase-like isoleucine patch superfamily enzyme
MSVYDLVYNDDLKAKGRNVTIFPQAILCFPENISIGDETVVDDFVFMYASGKGIEIGNFCHIVAGSHLQSGGLLKMGDFSALGPKCVVLAATDDYKGEGFIGLKVFGDKYRKTQFADVIIGRHAHIGAGSIILPGVTIGDGCSVGAGSVVTCDLPEWTICYGSPCKPVSEKPREKQLAMEAEFLREYENKNKPVVSVCCLAYNQEEFIADALDGFVKQQTDFPFEVIVHDDASTDRTPEIIREYAAARPDIFRPIFQTENQLLKNGVYPNVEFVFPAARGRYIALCDGDDYWTDPHKLQKQVDFMEQNPKFSLCYHDYRIKVGAQFVNKLENPRDYTSDELVAIGTANFKIATSTMLFRNYYSPETRRDFEEFKSHYMLVVLLGTFGGCKFIDGVLPSVYRKHGRNSWAGQPRADIIAQTKAKVVRIRELMQEKGNPRWIALREGVE